jgi:branched-chain amino acid transport system ATP-binding protein
MLTVKNLSVAYHDVPAIFGVDLQVNDGEIVSVVGSNGAGKSTLLKALAGILPRNGEITFDGERIDQLPPHKIVEKGISLIPEGRMLFGKLSIYQNLVLGSYQETDKEVRDQRIDEVYNIFPKLKERRNQLAGTLSGGEQQMVSIARGLMSNPKLLMLDEPSLGLAPIIVKEMFRLIQEIKDRHITILLVEQRLDEALKMSDRASNRVGW